MKTTNTAEELLLHCQEAERLLQAASYALKSYAFGNSAPDLAKDMATSIDRFLATGEPQILAKGR